MKREGWKLGIALVAVATLFVAGSIIVRPFPWLKAYEYNIIGKVTVGDKVYSFSGDNPLIIDNVRVIKGFGLASDGSKIFFDNQGGSEVKADQLGYLEGILYSPEKGVMEIGLNKNRLIKIDSAGVLSGEFNLDDSQKIVFSGQTSWRPYELNKIEIPSQLKIGVNSSMMIDPVILGLGGRNLYDVQTSWQSNNENVEVDQYGYVKVKKPGNYPNAVVLQVGEEKRAVTLAATQGIDKIIVSPAVIVAASGGQTFDLTFDPVSKGDDIRSASGITVTGTFVNPSGQKVTCGSYDKDFKQLKDCIFAATDDPGVWNLEFVIDEGGQQGKYVFPSVLTVIKKDNAVNISMLANVYNSKTTTNQADINPDNIVKIESEDTSNPNSPWYKFLRYKAVVSWPSFFQGQFVGKSQIPGWVGNTKAKISGGSLKVTFEGQGVSKSGEANVCALTSGKIEPPTIERPLANEYITSESSSFDLPLTTQDAVTMNAAIVQGCDFVAKVDATFDIQMYDGTMISGIKGNGEVRTAVAGRKQVSITGDVIVEQGDLQIKRLAEDQNLYLLVASDKVNATGGQGGTTGSVSDYQLSQDSTYIKMISTLRDKVNKLITERGTTVDLNDVTKLEQFFTIDKQKNPEGRILVANNASGPVVLDNNTSSDLKICAPTTLVVYGRDVEIKDNIVMKSDDGSTCVERGNFGLIVFDGDIKFDGAVTNVEGFYFTTGTIHTGLSHAKFALNGVAFAHDYALERY